MPQDNNNIDFVYTTIWNDDGCETNQFMALNSLPYYSEYCFKGEACTEKDIFEVHLFGAGTYAKLMAEDIVKYNTNHVIIPYNDKYKDDYFEEV